MDGANTIVYVIIGLALTVAVHLFAAARWSGRMDGKQESILEEIKLLREAKHLAAGQLARHEGAISSNAIDLGRLDSRLSRLEMNR